MAGWLDWLTGEKNKSAGQAKDRLKLVLINDRTDLSPAEMERMKNDILEVIARYIEIDPSTVSVTLAQEGREQRLLADIPLHAPRRRAVR